MSSKMYFSIFGTSQAYLAVLKVDTNADGTVKNAYTVKPAWKFETAKKNQCFIETASETPHSQLATFQSILVFF